MHLECIIQKKKNAFSDTTRPGWNEISRHVGLIMSKKLSHPLFFAWHFLSGVLVCNDTHKHVKCFGCGPSHKEKQEGQKKNQIVVLPKHTLHSKTIALSITVFGVGDVCQMRIVPSSEPEENVRPSGANRKTQTGP